MEWLSVSFAFACIVFALVGHVKWAKSPLRDVGFQYALVGLLCFFGVLAVASFMETSNRFGELSIAGGVTMFCCVRKIQWYKRHEK